MAGLNFDNGGRRCIRPILEQYQSGTRFNDNKILHYTYYSHPKKAKVKATSLNAKKKIFRSRIIH